MASLFPEPPAEAISRAQELSAKLNRANHEYYVLSRPSMSDAQWDELFHELRKLEEAYPSLRTKDSPTQRVGAPSRDDMPKVEHDPPMFSLANAMNADEVREFWRRMEKELGSFELVCEPKFDGLSIDIVYLDGEYWQASTRSDGEIGEDVTANVLTIEGLPRSLNLKRGEKAPRRVAIRGEILMLKADFLALNNDLEEAGQPAFANPRNAASGALRQLDPEKTRERRLSMFLYQIGRIDGGDAPATQMESLELLNRWGFPVADLARLAKSEDEAVGAYEALEAKRHELPFEVDGMVFKVQDLTQQAELGYRSRTPRWAV
ncbi:MAG: NAD-dependent DNA ligase LigA, partial [Planctomycetes bacterium]|nr:NAD-dependent DNA ligase LigA [Planctomycetota bacterium]